MRFLILSALVAVSAAAPQFYPLSWPFAPSLSVGDLQAADINARSFYQDQTQFAADQARLAADLERTLAESKKFEAELKKLAAETPKAEKPAEPKVDGAEPKVDEAEPKVDEAKPEEPKKEEPGKAAEPAKPAELAKPAEKLAELSALKLANPWAGSLTPLDFSAPFPYYQSFPSPYYF